MAQSIAENVWASKEAQPRDIWELFPGMFEEERKRAEVEKEEAELREAKANRRIRAEQMRMRREERRE